MKNHFVIGLNSGTSFDGIDTALVKFSKGSLTPTFIDGFVYKYPNGLKERIRKLITPVETCRGMSLEEISQLNFLIGEIFAEAANTIIKRNKLINKDILLIGSHGQTIFHHPQIESFGKYRINSTLQIGESSIIASKTGIKTVSNFRESDIAAGGTGAPLIPYLDQMVFGNSKIPKAALNIGGISNITIVGKNITPIAFDIGPGNGLIDLICNIYFKKDFDLNGKIAKTGKIDFTAIEKALRDPYFKQKPPKSNGKEYFNLKFIEKYFAQIKNSKDKIATLTYFTAKTIERAFHNFIFPKYKIGEIVISGGGIRNKILMQHLKKLLTIETPRSVSLFVHSDKYNLPYKYKEAILFALLGYTCFKGIPNNIPSCTGAKKKAILGKIVNV